MAKRGNFAEKLKSTAKKFKIPELVGIPEQVNSEEFADLEHEIEVSIMIISLFKKLRNAKHQFEVELDQSRTNEKLLQLENDRLINENAILKVEANNAYILIDSNASLKKELESLRTLVSGTTEIKYNILDPYNNPDRQLKEENLLLHEKLAEILKENRELSSLSSRKNAKDLDTSQNSERNTERETLDTTSMSMSTLSASATARSNNFRIKSGGLTPKSRVINPQ
jgi:hypothetical protein